MTPTELNQAISRVVPDGAEIDAVQVLMLGPDAAEVKVRLAADGAWLQGVVNRREWAA